MKRDEIFAQREEILRLAAKRGGVRVRLFGSLARGEEDADSDADFVVTFEPGRSLFDQGGLVMDLQDLLHCRVDVVSEKAIRPRFRRRIEKEAILL